MPRLGAHEQYRGRLAELRHDALFGALLDRWAGANGYAREGTWRRVYGRFHPWAEPYARLVFEWRQDPRAGDGRDDARVRRQGFAVLEVTESRPRDGAPVCLPLIGWAQCQALDDDRTLTTLSTVLGREPGAEIVRYRPGRRCTFRTGPGPLRYGKVFPDEAGRAIHQEGEALWCARERGELGFAVAEPLAWDAEHRVLWQQAVNGVPLLEKLSTPAGVGLARRMGAAAATITTSSLRPATRFDADVQCARTRSYARELGDRVPSLREQAEHLSGSLAAIHAARPGRARPIHGAPHVNQWLQDGETLALVDFDRVSIGDPELDVATFLGELDFEEELTTPVEEIAAAFLSGYETVTGPLDPLLLSAYRGHKRLAKALRSARALRPDGDARATRHLASAWPALDQLGGRS